MQNTAEPDRRLAAANQTGPGTRAAVELPPELVDALSQAVLDHLVEIGVAVRKVG